MLAPVRTVAPTEPLISVQDAKAHLRVDHDEEDALIASLIAAAESHLDGWTGVLGRALVTQTWRQDFASFDDMRLPLWPVASVSSVTYKDATGAVQTVPASDYELLADGLGAYVAVKSSPASSSVSVTFVAGQPVADVPAAIRHAALFIVGDLYRNRETAVVGATASQIPVSATVNALITPFRRVGL
jgi:uncharacterized phiE125 gp8 family phage protein